jgi:hypothetical protein
VRLTGVQRTALGLILAVLPACATARPPRPAAEPQAAPDPGAPDAPVIREIEINGATVFPRETLLRYIRLRPGARLRRPTADVARDLQERYRVQGYLGARVEAAFSPETGVLTLAVDEGRLTEVVIEGVEGKGAERARAELALETGAILREKDVRAALHRLQDRAAGAYSYGTETPYVVESEPGIVRLRLKLVQRRARLTVWPEGPDLSPLSNRVDGFSPGLGATFTLFDAGAFNHADLYGRVAYGMASKKVRYAVGALKPLGPDHLLTIGAEIHDLTDTDDVFRRALLDQPRGRTVPFSITEDYFRRKGYETYAFLRPTPRVHLGVSFRSDTYASLPVERDDSVFFLKRTPRPNPPVGEGLMRSILITARFAGQRELYAGWTEERESFVLRSAYGGRYERAQRFRADTTLEVASPGTLGGDFSFRRLITHVRGTRVLAVRHSLSARALVGVTGGTPPPQRRFALGGAGTLRGYGLKEFQGENAFLGTVEWKYQPPSRYPALVLFYDGGKAWTASQPGSGWRDDAGVGFEWPGARPYLRLDVGVPLRGEGGARGARVHALLRLPF